MAKLKDLSLDGIPAKKVYLAQAAAATRLHLFVIGEVHEALMVVTRAGTAVLDQYSGDDEIPAAAVVLAQQALMSAWDEFIRWYTDMLTRAMRTAASLPFGTWGVLHAEWMLPNVAAPIDEAVHRSVNGRLILEAVDVDSVFIPQLESVMVSAADKTYGDSVTLSQRIWNLDVGGRNGLNLAVSTAAAEGKSAWQLAQDVEQFLGAGADCPRWTHQRLNGLTKKQIAAGDRTGLFTGDACAGQGVSYNALRLARTEIQSILNTATSRNFKQIPWIELERVNLSPAHAETDICDDVASGGENNDGSYPVGDVALPLHPNCLCYRTAVLMDDDAFVGKLKGWLDGREGWAEMDTYKNTLQGELWTDLRESAVGVQLAWWTWGESADLAGVFWNVALGEFG